MRIGKMKRKKVKTSVFVNLMNEGIIFAFVFTLLAVPVVADELVPVSTNDAVQQWQGFWSTNSIDPANHVVWKLYVFRTIPQRQSPNGEKAYLITGLTPFPKSSYYVGLRINLLYNYIKNIPKRGDTIVVSGRIITRRDYLLDLTTKEVPIKLLTMDLDGAANLPDHFDPAATPTEVPATAITPVP